MGKRYILIKNCVTNNYVDGTIDSICETVEDSLEESKVLDYVVAAIDSFIDDYEDFCIENGELEMNSETEEFSEDDLDDCRNRCESDLNETFYLETSTMIKVGEVKVETEYNYESETYYVIRL